MSTPRKVRGLLRRSGVVGVTLVVAIAVVLALTVGAASGRSAAQHRASGTSAVSKAASSARVSSRAHARASSASRAATRHANSSFRSSHASSFFSSFGSSSSALRFLAAASCGGANTIAAQTGFEDADGNLAVDTAGCTDWNSFSPTWTGTAPFQTGSATLGGLFFAGATDAVNSTSDSIYAGGVKQDTTCPGTTTGKANDKADLARIYVAGETINGQTYLFLSWERQLDTTVNSDVFVSFEFNQGTVSCGAGSPFVQRTPGDLLFDYNFQSGNSTIDAEQWDGTTWQPLPTPPFEASVNSGTVTDTIGPSGSVDLTKFEFGEAGINLSGLKLTGNGGRACESFGSVLGGSRTSQSGDTAQLKDYIGPAPFDVSNCAKPTIVTTQQPASGSTTDTYKDKATISGLVTPDGTGSLTFNLYSQADCKGTPLDTETIKNISANGDYPTPTGLELDTAGTYYWVASFSGDNFNDPSSSGCNDEPVVVNAPSLSVVKKADAASVSAGDPLGFTITVSNGGPGTAKGVTLDDPLPGGTKAGWTLDSNSGSATCSISNGDLTCSAVDLASGDSYVLHISADTNYDNCTKYDNTATASASNAPDAKGSDSIQCNKPSLTVVKKADNASVNAGDPLGFTITVSNGGPGVAKGVTLDDPLPGGTKAGWTLDSNSGSATCSISSGDLTCSAVDLASGDSYVLHISADTNYDNCTKYDNTATASASNAPNAQGSDSIQCLKPSLTVVKKADNASVNAGDPIGFTITVSNGGPGTAEGVTLDDPLPGGTKAGWTLDSNSGSATCSIGNGDLTCSAVDLASGDSYALHISADTNYDNCTKYDNTATASASNAPNAQGSDSIQCLKPSLTVTKKADASSVNAGDPIGFTITVSNGGPGTAKGVTLNDPLPGGTKAGWTLDSNSGSASCSISNGDLTCSAVDLASGDSYVLHISADTSNAACTTYDNTATASASNAPDATGEDKITCLAPGLTVIKKADSATVNAGDPIGFTITVSNGGPGAANNVTLDDPLPGGTKAGWTLDSNSGSATCSISNGDLTCSAVTLNAGDSYVLHISAGTDYADCTKYDNTATASASNAPDAQGSDSIQCLKPSLTVVKKADNASVNAGDPLGFTITVSNGGPGTAKGVTLDDPLPSGTKAGWTLDSNSGSANCSISNGDLTCSSVDLNAGDSYVLHISAGTDYADCTKYDNTATASSSNAPEAQGSDSIQCNKPSLSVTKTADANSVSAGDPIGFTIVVANGGPGTAKGVTLDDPLPTGTKAGWTLDSNTGSANCSISNATPQHLTCSAVDLKSGESYTVHISAGTSSDACTEYDNNATASATNAPDAQGSDDITCNAANVSITKTADHSAPVHAGDQIGFTVEVKNTGSGAATGVNLADPLPAGSGSGVTWSIDSSVGTPGQFVLSGAKGSQTLSLDGTTLPAGADYKVHIVASTSQTECSVYDNTATLTTANAANPEPASASESCAYRVDLSVTKSGSPASQTLTSSSSITWTIVVTNNGPDTDTGVTIADPMPTGNTFVSAQSSQGTCTGGAILNCTIGTMAAGAQVTITLVTKPSVEGPQVNTVNVAGDRPETNTANNTATATVQVFKGQPPVFCVAVSRVTPKQLFVGRKTKLTIHVTQHGKAVKGVHVRIKGPKVNIRTKASNSKGVITRMITLRKAGILIFSPIASKRCNTQRVGVTNVFTPPVTG